MESYQTAVSIAKKLSERKAKNILLINISEKSSFADYFINATAGSERQLGALSDEVQKYAIELGLEIKGVEGRTGSTWILIDLGDVIVNLFTADTREKYSIDKLWSDCEAELIEDWG